MKLILCRHCTTTTVLRHEVVSCVCGASQGVYLDDRSAIYSGPCVPLGIDNDELVAVLADKTTMFSGFRIPATSRWFRRVDDALERLRLPPHKRVGLANRSFISPHQKS